MPRDRRCRARCRAAIIDRIESQSSKYQSPWIPAACGVSRVYFQWNAQTGLLPDGLAFELVSNAVFLPSSPFRIIHAGYSDARH